MRCPRWARAGIAQGFFSLTKVDKLNSPTTVVHLASGDLWAGAEVQLYYHARELHKDKAINLFIILLNHGILEKKLNDLGINITVFDERKLSSLQIFFRIYSFLKKNRPSIVHTHRQKENVLGSAATLLYGKAKSLRTVHGSSESRPGLMQLHKQFFHLMDWISGRFIQDAIVAVSAPLAEELTKRFSAKIISIIENGIDIDELQNKATESISLPGPAAVIRVAIVGRLVPVKRIDIFLDIAHALNERQPNRYAFYIFGDGPLLTMINNKIGQLGLNYVVYMLGFLPNIAAHLSKMDILLITSDHEGLPMNLLEALTLSVPVVAHAVGGIPQVLHYGDFGTLVYDQNITQYVNTIEDYAKNPQLLLEKAAAAHDVTKKSYSSKVCAQRYSYLYAILVK